MVLNFARFCLKKFCTITTDTMAKRTIVFVLGGPGAGKGTQCSKIVEHFGYVHLSAGDLLREEKSNSKSEVGKLINAHITNGTIVPVEITCGLLEKAMDKTMEADPNKDKFLIDGFPRNHDNLDGWNKTMKDKVDLKFVLIFDCSEATCIKRILNRGKTSGRADDNMESLKKRFQTFTKQTQPIIEHYAAEGKVRTVNAENCPEEVFEEVKKLF